MNDLISRQEAIKAIDDLPNCYNGYSDTYDKSLIIGVIEELPSAEPKKGKWIEDEYGIRHCCYCNCINNTVYRNFCPNCGADMRGEE